MKNLLTASFLVFAITLTFGCESGEKAETAESSPVVEDTSDVYVEPLVLDDEGNVVAEKKEKKSWWPFGKKKDHDEEMAYAEEDEKKGWSLFGKKKNAADDEDGLTADEVLSDLSPELQGLAHTPSERRIQVARTLDTDVRALDDDLLKVLYLDRPKRIGVTPIP